MSEYIYRYRPLKYLLSELKNQQIYASPSTDLNDPVEGYLDLYWQGDQILWKNLFKHYLQCLMYVVAINDGTVALKSENIPVFLFENKKATEFSRKINLIYNIFFSDKSVEKLMNLLSEADKKVRRSELLFYFLCFHGLATRIVLKVILESSDFDEGITNSSNAIDESLSQFEDEQLLIKGDYSYDQGIFLIEQDNITNFFKNPKILENKNKIFLTKEFPKQYMEQLEELLYPKWHAVCFSEDIENASLWSHYADQHKGVCLKFKTRIQGGKHGLFLKTTNGISGARKMKNYQFVPLHKINYEGKYPEIDFFNSLGQLPHPKILDEWHGDGAGNFSERVKKTTSEEWHEQYWENFYKSRTLKLKEWKYEAEHRLVVTGDLMETSQDRLLGFDFSDLEEVIFGLRTPLSEKLEILKILETKCQQHNQYHVKVLQASYSHISGKIETNSFYTHFEENSKN